MPQAPQRLRDQFSDDREAWQRLGGNYTDTAGLLRPKLGHVPTAGELDAIDYLCLEWDYAFES